MRPSRRDGMIGSDRRATIRTTNQSWVKIRPCPPGQLPFSRRYEAINCLATFIKSLRRDKRRLTPVHEFVARALPRGRIRERDHSLGYRIEVSGNDRVVGIERWAACRETGSRMAARISSPWSVQSRAKLRVNAPAKSAGV
jgi:hypothetical protein